MPTFLPDTLNGWLSLLVQLFATVAAIVAFNVRLIRQPLKEQADKDRADVERHLKEQGERIGGVTSAISTNSARIEATDRVVERLHLTQTSLAEQSGRMDARVDRLMDAMEKGQRERLDEDRRIGERLASIETQLGFLIQGQRP